jgi:flagellin-like protein
MRLKQLFEEDDAVSPVIGVILMVAITVILAAVIATFVLGLGEQVSDTAPQASFSFDYDDNVTSDTDSWGQSPPGSADGLLTVQHSGGPNIDAGLLGVAGSNAVPGSSDYSDFSTSNEGWAGDEMSAGNRVDLFLANDDSVSITWTSEDGTTSATLQTYDAPES